MCSIKDDENFARITVSPRSYSVPLFHSPIILGISIKKPKTNTLSNYFSFGK